MGFSTGNCASGSPIIFRMILNRLGSSPTTGRTLRATGLYFFLVDRVPCRSAIVDRLVAECDFETNGYGSFSVLVALSLRAKVAMSEVSFPRVWKVTSCLGAIDCVMLVDEEKDWCPLVGGSCRVCRLTGEIEKGSRGFSSCRKKLNAENEYFGG